VIGNLWTTN